MSIERQLTVPLQALLSKLSDNGIRIEQFTLPPRLGGNKLYMLGWKVDPFPFCEREWAWYPLIIKEGQTEVHRDTVDATLRHVWHSIMPFFEDQLEDQLKPDGAHEQEIAEKVDAKARAIRDKGEKWGDHPFEELRASMTFDPSESELDYLEVRLHWRQETAISN